MAVSQPHFEQERSEPNVELLPALDDPEVEEDDEPENAKLSEEEQLVSSTPSSSTSANSATDAC